MHLSQPSFSPGAYLAGLVATLSLTGCAASSFTHVASPAAAPPPATTPGSKNVATHSRATALTPSDRGDAPTASGCLDELLTRDVAFLPLRRARGVTTPVQIEGPVAGIRYRPTTPFGLVVDCRFALVLADLGPILRRHGVMAVEYSNAHAYRPTRAGRLSLHANGLALDVHGAIFEDGGVQWVQRDFSRRLGARGCAESARPLNQLACDLQRTGWFSEFLTPDYNRDHADHFHFAIARQGRAASAP